MNLLPEMRDPKADIFSLGQKHRKLAGLPVNDGNDGPFELAFFELFEVENG